MTTLMLLDVHDRPLWDEDAWPAEERPAPVVRRSERTLDDLITGTWDDLCARRPVACPVCAAPLEPRYGATSRPVAARCSGCGSELS